MSRGSRKLGFLLAAMLIPWLACARKHSGSPPAPPSAAASVVSVQVSPVAASVVVGHVQTFTVSVSGTSDPTVVWTVNGIPGGNSALGTIVPTPGGADYSPMSIPNPNPVIVAATSQADPSASGSASVSVDYANDTSQAQSLPILLGTSGGNALNSTKSGSTVTCCSGTLGCLVEREGAFFILSNNHVLDDSGQASLGDPVCQPGLTDNRCIAGTLVANLFQAAPVQTSNVDAALAQIVAGAVDTSGAILDLGPAGSQAIAPAPPSGTLADPGAVLAGGARVAKSGRSTGLTCGTLLSINTDVSVDYSNSCAGPVAFTVTFHNQLLIREGSFSAAGDSGSLIVTSDTARPLGLLYAANGSTTVASPIADVLAALKNASTGAVPKIVGGADHSVSCSPVATVTPSQAEASAPTPLEFRRASAAREKFGAGLLADPAVRSVGIGSSADNPGESAILITVEGIPTSSLPRQLGGVRTRILRQDKAAGSPGAALSPDRLALAMAVKARQADLLLGKSGVTGVGIGKSADAEGEAALIIFVERGGGFPGVEVEIEGQRTRIIEGERFRTFGWGTTGSSPSGCCGGH